MGKIVNGGHQMNKKRILKQEELEECIEYILQNKAGWTMFTNWVTGRKGIGHTKANRMWNECWEAIRENADNKIAYDVQTAFIELEDLKNRSKDNGDRRTELEALKYQNKLIGNENNDLNVNLKVEAIDVSWNTDSNNG